MNNTLSEYELLRARNIARNNAFLATLGISGIYTQQVQIKPPARNWKYIPQDHQPGWRRSARLRKRSAPDRFTNDLEPI